MAIDKILVCLDGSANEMAVLAEAVHQAREGRAALVLFRVISVPVGLPPEAYLAPPDRIEALLRSRAQEDLERIAATLPKVLATEVRVAIGVPWQAICAAATREQARLIVIGSHGYHLYERLLGTTASRVVNHADVTVVVVKPPRAS